MKKNRLVFSAMLLLLLISGCNGNSNSLDSNISVDNSTSVNSSISENKPDVYMSGKKIKIDKRFVEFREMCEYNQYTYLSAIYDFSESELTQCLYDVNNDLMTELSWIYDSIIDLAVDTDRYYYTLESEGDSRYVCKYDIKTQKLLNDIPVGFYEEIKVSGENIYCFNREQCDVYDKQLNYKNTIIFSDYYDNTCSSYDVVLDSYGNLYRIAYDKENRVYTLISVSAEGDERYITSDFGDLSASCDGKITGFFIYNNNRICLSTSSYENENIQFVNMIDTNSGKTIDRLEIEDAQFICSGVKGYDLTYKFNDSLYGYNITDVSSEIIYSDSDYIKNIQSYSEWNCSEDNIMIEFYSDTSYNGDSEIVLILDENMNVVDFHQGAAIDKPFYVSEQSIYFIQKSFSDDQTEVIDIIASTDGLSRMDYASFETDDFVSAFWIYNDIIWTICSDFEDNRNLLKCYDKSGQCISEQEFPYSLLCHKVIDGKNTAVLTDGNKVFLSEILEDDILKVYVLENTKLSERFFECYEKNQNLFHSYDVSDNCMKEVDVATSEKYNPINFSDFGINSVNGVIKKQDNYYVVSGIDYEGRSSLWKISNQDKPCKELYISGVNIPDFYMSIIHDYDDLNDEIKIIIKNYDTVDDEVISDLDKELIFGKTPDIIIGNTGLSIYEYAKKYPLYDMKVLLDEGINKADFLECTFTDCNSEIIQVIPFMPSIYSCKIPKENNTFEGWSYMDFVRYMKDNRNNVYLSMADYWTSILLNAYLYNHIDFVNETCDFENELFYELLEFIKEFSVSEDYFDSDDISIDNQLAWDFQNIIYHAEDTDNLYSFKEIPDENGGHILFSEEYGMIIPATAQNPDEALNFIEYLLSDEVQAKAEKTDIFPSCRKNLFRMLKEKTAMYALENEEYSKIKQNEFKNILDKPMIADISASKIFSIVSQEIYDYCENGASAQETAEKIQNKVKIYLCEL